MVAEQLSDPVAKGQELLQDVPWSVQGTGAMLLVNRESEPAKESSRVVQELPTVPGAVRYGKK